MDRLETFLELESPGAIAVRVIEEDDHLLIAPDLVEMVGGPDDGAECFPSITVRLLELLELFDEVLGATWNTQHRELNVDGKIGGKDVSVTIQREPFEDVEKARFVFEEGVLRAKDEDED